MRRELHRLHAVTFTGPTGTFRQRTDPTKPQIDLYTQLGLPLPKKIIEITPDMRRMRVTAAFPPWHTRSAAEVVERLEVTTLPGTAISARPPPPVRIDHGDVVRQVVGYQGEP